LRILDRYIGQVVQISVLAALSVILVVFVLSKFVNEYNNIGRADYSTWVATIYVLLWLPTMIYQVFPMAALLGTMLGLGMLANHSELVVVRASGVSKFRIAIATLKSMVALVVIVFFIGEVIAPQTEQYAEQMKLKALESRVSLNTEYGLWMRDGNTFINVRSVDFEGTLRNVTLNHIDPENGLTLILHAETAKYDGKQWQLHNVLESHVGHDGVKQIHFDTKSWESLIDPEMLDTISFNPDSLSLWSQIEYIDYLRNNGLNYRLYELAMWNKIVAPFTIMAMVLLGVPFIFRSQRNTNLGKQVVLGFLIGIIFYIGNRLMGQVGLVYDIPAALSASIPTLVILAATGWLFKRDRN